MKLEKDELLVFTDLDGTLLDHDTYSFEAALPCINLLKNNDIPIIINKYYYYELHSP